MSGPERYGGRQRGRGQHGGAGRGCLPVMEWGRLYANLPDDPRVQAAEAASDAGWLLIESICYCTRAESDGFIPNTQVSRFGAGPKLRKKVAALVREGLWVPVENGYVLDPELWSEERNLSDQAEKKRKADRERIARKRADAKTKNGHESCDMSHDSRATNRATPAATGDATRSGDSRGAEKRREEVPIAHVVSHPSVRNARRDDDDDDSFVAEVAGAVLERTGEKITPGRARDVIAEILSRASRPVRDRRNFVLKSIANECDPYAFLPPLPARPSSMPFARRPGWCGDPECRPDTRRREDPVTGNDLGPCPKCSNALPRTEAS